jgi:hypothetical protein
LAVLLAALMLLGMVPAAPAASAAEEGTWSLSSTPRTIERKGVKYKLSFSVYDSFGGDPSFSISLSKILNPKGVRRSMQSHTFSFTLDGRGEFVHNFPKTLEKASVNTAGDMDDWGKVAMRFVKESGGRNTCDKGGVVRQAKGELNGDFVFKTGTKRFGKITEAPRKGTLFYSKGDCQDGVDPNPTFPCPRASSSLFGSRTGDNFSVHASKLKGADAASVFASYSKNLKGGHFRSSMIWATLPASKLSVESNLSAGKINGAKSTYLSGAANFAKTAPLQDTGPTPCGSNDGTARYLSRQGEITGDFTAGYFLGGKKTIKGNKLPQASASRTVR